MHAELTPAEQDQLREARARMHHAESELADARAHWRITLAAIGSGFGKTAAIARHTGLAYNHVNRVVSEERKARISA